MIEQLENLGLYLNQPEPAIICIQCKFALKPNGTISRGTLESGMASPSRLVLLVSQYRSIEVTFT